VTDAEACAAEIIALHEVFQRVLGAPSQDDAGRIEAAFAAEFVMIMPNGRRLDRAEVIAFLRQARGARGEGFRISIEEVSVLHAAPPLMLMHYLERQFLHGYETTRRAAALFRMDPAGPRWLFVQETWVSPPPT
jgi:hypothetical protein